MKLFGSGNKNKRQNSGRDNSYNRHRPAGHEDREASQEGIQKNQRKKRRGGRIVLLVLLIIFGTITTGYLVWVRAPAVNREGLAGTEKQREEDAVAPSPNVSDEPDDGVGRRKGVYTFLVVANDDGNGNTDTMLLGLLDTVAGSLDVVSIPRDTLVNVRWETPKKVNRLLSMGGEEGLIEGIRDLIGYKVDCFAVLDMEAFVKIVDTIGGVDYYVPRDMVYYDPDQNFRIALYEGQQHLDGEQALGVVRFRGYGNIGYEDGDIGRMRTQQDFLKTLAKQLLTLGNIPKVDELYKIIEEYVQTGLTNGDKLTTGNMAFFVQEFLKLDSENIRFHRVPGNDYCGIITPPWPELSYVSIYVDEWLELLNEVLNPFHEEITAANLNILTYENGEFHSTTGELNTWEW